MEKKSLLRGLICFIGVLLVVNIAAALPSKVAQPEKKQVLKSYGQLPLYFIENKGQIDNKVKFYEKSHGHAMFFTEDEIHFNFHKTKGETSESCSVKLKPVGMGKDVTVVAEEPQKGKVNYFMGKDNTKWKANIPTYKAVTYQEAYSGIDLKFYGNNQQLEYDIVVKKGGDPSIVKFQYSGIDDLKITKEGDLSIRLKNRGVLIQRKPISYQIIDGKRVEVDAKFKIYKTSQQFVYGFEVASYNGNHLLIIDPVLAYST